MKPSKSILDPSFRYVPSVATSVANTWRRFGWNPSSAEERNRVVENAVVAQWKLEHADDARG